MEAYREFLSVEYLIRQADLAGEVVRAEAAAREDIRRAREQIRQAQEIYEAVAAGVDLSRESLRRELLMEEVAARQRIEAAQREAIRAEQRRQEDAALIERQRALAEQFREIDRYRLAQSEIEALADIFSTPDVRPWLAFQPTAVDQVVAELRAAVADAKADEPRRPLGAVLSEKARDWLVQNVIQILLFFLAVNAHQRATSSTEIEKAQLETLRSIRALLLSTAAEGSGVERGTLTRRLILRGRPSWSGPRLRTLPKDETVDIIEVKGEWLLVVATDEAGESWGWIRRGWIR